MSIEHGVDALLDALLDRLEGDAGGVGALRAAHDVDADALAPGGELLDGGGAERVGRAEGHGEVLGDEDAGELADGGGLAGAVDADDEDDAGLAVGAAHLQAAVHGRVDELEQLFAEYGAGVGVRTALDAQPGPQSLDQLGGRRDPDVGGQQGVLDGLPGVLVEAIAAEQREQSATERALRAGQAAGAAGPGGTPCLRASRGSAPAAAGASVGVSTSRLGRAAAR